MLRERGGPHEGYKIVVVFWWPWRPGWAAIRASSRYLSVQMPKRRISVVADSLCFFVQ